MFYGTYLLYGTCRTGANASTSRLERAADLSSRGLQVGWELGVSDTFTLGATAVLGCAV